MFVLTRAEPKLVLCSAECSRTSAMPIWRRKPLRISDHKRSVHPPETMSATTNTVRMKLLGLLKCRNFASDKATLMCRTNIRPVAPGRENVLVWGDAVARGERAFYSPFFSASSRMPRERTDWRPTCRKSTCRRGVGLEAAPESR